MGAFEALWLVPHIIFIPWSTYNTIQFYNNKYQMFIQKRTKSLAFGFVCTLLYGMITLASIIIAELYLDIVALRIAYISCVVGFFLLLFYLNTRSWMIYYQYYWNYYALQLDWQQVINSNYVEEQHRNNWFIKNKHNYGNLKFVIKMFGAIHLIAFVIMVVAMNIRVDYPEWDVFFTPVIAIIFASVSIFYSIIRYKTPSFNDIFYISWESKIIARLLLVAAPIVPFFRILSSIVHHHNVQAARILVNLSPISATILYFMIHYTCTKMVIHKNERPNNAVEQSLAMIVNNDRKMHMRLTDILSNENNLNVFIKYLSRELRIHLIGFRL